MERIIGPQRSPGLEVMMDQVVYEARIKKAERGRKQQRACAKDSFVKLK